VPDLVRAGAVAIEDGDEVAAHEVALFHLLNLVRENAASVLLTARSPPWRWGLETADLLSRLRALPAVEIEVPDDALLRSLLVKLFVDRQLIVDTTIIDYLARHIDRSFAAARSAVAALDQEALSRGRRITRALAADVLIDRRDADASDT
jgi:chromosomal replication initiation ATPase DnaA